MSDWYTTIAIEKSVLEMIKNLKVFHHWIEMKSNSDKLKALLLKYESDLR